jgi:hypothetical protein
MGIYIYISYKTNPRYEFYLNIQDNHIIFHYPSIPSSNNNHVTLVNFNLLMQPISRRMEYEHVIQLIYATILFKRILQLRVGYLLGYKDVKDDTSLTTVILHRPTYVYIIFKHCITYTLLLY